MKNFSGIMNIMTKEPILTMNTKQGDLGEAVARLWVESANCTVLKIDPDRYHLDFYCRKTKLNSNKTFSYIPGNYFHAQVRSKIVDKGVFDKVEIEKEYTSSVNRDEINLWLKEPDTILILVIFEKSINNFIQIGNDGIPKSQIFWIEISTEKMFPLLEKNSNQSVSILFKDNFDDFAKWVDTVSFDFFNRENQVSFEDKYIKKLSNYKKEIDLNNESDVSFILGINGIDESIILKNEILHELEFPDEVIKYSEKFLTFESRLFKKDAGFIDQFGFLFLDLKIKDKDSSKKTIIYEFFKFINITFSIFERSKIFGKLEWFGKLKNDSNSFSIFYGSEYFDPPQNINKILKTIVETNINLNNISMEYKSLPIKKESQIISMLNNNNSVSEIGYYTTQLKLRCNRCFKIFSDDSFYVMDVRKSITLDKNYKVNVTDYNGRIRPYWHCHFCGNGTKVNDLKIMNRHQNEDQLAKYEFSKDEILNFPDLKIKFSCDMEHKLVKTLVLNDDNEVEEHFNYSDLNRYHQDFKEKFDELYKKYSDYLEKFK